MSRPRALSALAALALSLGALSACSSDDESDESTPSAQQSETPSAEETDGTEESADPDEETPSEQTEPDSGSQGDESAPDDEAAEPDDGGELQVTDGSAVTSADGQFSITLSEGWEAYPAPIEGANFSILLVSDVNESESPANITGAWVEIADAGWDEWIGEVRPSLEEAGATVEDAPEITVDGQSVQGIRVVQQSEEGEVVQLAYPVFYEDGVEELYFSADSAGIDANWDDAQAMLESVVRN